MKRIAGSALSLLVLAACSSTAAQDPELKDSRENPSTEVTDLSQSTASTQLEKPPELVRLEEVWDLAASRPGADIGQVFQLFRLKQSLGPKNLACYDQESGDVCEKIVDAINIVGLTELQVTLLLDSLELPHRVIERDCELLMVTQEFVAGRVNLAVSEGGVTGWASEGGRNFEASENC